MYSKNEIVRVGAKAAWDADGDGLAWPPFDNLPWEARVRSMEIMGHAFDAMWPLLKDNIAEALSEQVAQIGEDAIGQLLRMIRGGQYGA